MSIKKNNTVKVHYVGTLDDGSIFDKSKEDSPLEFIVGAGQLIPGFENAVEGMSLNEEKNIKIKADDAYGQRNEDLVKDFPRSFFPNGFNPENGALLTLEDNMGRPIPGIVKSVSVEKITLDLNHPLAGKNLNFKIQVTNIEE